MSTVSHGTGRQQQQQQQQQQQVGGELRTAAGAAAGVVSAAAAAAAVSAYHRGWVSAFFAPHGGLGVAETNDEVVSGAANAAAGNDHNDSNRGAHAFWTHVAIPKPKNGGVAAPRHEHAKPLDAAS